MKPCTTRESAPNFSHVNIASETSLARLLWSRPFATCKIECMQRRLPLSLTLLLSLGCASTESVGAGELRVGDAFTINIVPIFTSAQADMIDEASSIEVIVREKDGSETVLSMTSDDGRNYQNRDIRKLDDSELLLVGRDDGGVVFHGRSAPITISEGSVTAQIFVARDGEAVALPGLPEPSAFAATVALGGGQFLRLGGSAEGLQVQRPRPEVTLFSLRDLGTNAGEITLDDGVHFGQDSGWAGLTATRLDDGRVLAAGGTQRLSDSGGNLWGHSFATSAVTIVDPISGESESVAPLNHARFGHTAVLSDDGNVAVIGGFLWSGSAPTIAQFIEHYDPTTDAWTSTTASLYTGGAFHAQAHIPGEGVMVCGGLSASFVPTNVCQRVTTDGVVSMGPTLPQALLHASLTTLKDGRLLLSGGLVASSTTAALSLQDSLTATSQAWILEGDSWRAVASMRNARAMHGAALAPDGSVLVAGGVTQVNQDSTRDSLAYAGLFYDPTDAIACAESFDPETESFVPMSNCSGTGSAGTLPDAVAKPDVVSDPVFGPLVVGGVLSDLSESSDQRILIYPSFADLQ